MLLLSGKILLPKISNDLFGAGENQQENQKCWGCRFYHLKFPENQF
jgi:hypothetical protein